MELFDELGPQWMDNGADIIGGCCRTTPKHIQFISTDIIINRDRKYRL